MSNRLLTTMQSNVGNNVQDTSVSLAALIKNWINDRYTEILRRLNFLDNSRLDYTFTTTGGQEDYVLPDDFGSEIYVVDKTNAQELIRRDAQSWMDRYADSSDIQGLPTSYFIQNSNVRKQPTSVSVLTVVSSNVGDTTQTVYVRGILNGREDYETINLNGTSSVPGSKSWDRILAISKSAATTGQVTATTNSGAVTVAILSSEMLEHRVKIMRLVQIPNSAFTIEVGYIQKLLPLNNQYDYPIIDCADALEAGATADAWRYKRQFAKAADFEVIFNNRINDIAWQYENQPNLVHRLNPKPYLRDTN